MSENYLVTRGLGVGYGKKALIHDICLEIKKGDIVTLIGPNGSGKSTILKSLTRQLSLVSGSVYIDSKDLTAIPFSELSKKQAVVLTERIHPELMTCHEVVATGRYPYTGRLGILSARDEEIVEEAMEMVHAKELGGSDFNAISDGQKQRVLLARALAQEPELIILDEPTSFLDVRHKLDLLMILKKLAREKSITVLMSLHEIDLAQKIADLIVCVKGETIPVFGPPEEIFREDLISDLYDLRGGSYDPLFGSMELSPAAGPSRTFVISGEGSGIPVYRRLQKEEVPFSAGILFSNDLDCRLARLLAREVVVAPAFSPIPKKALERALSLIDASDQVYICPINIREGNQEIALLIEKARESQKALWV